LNPALENPSQVEECQPAIKLESGPTAASSQIQLQLPTGTRRNETHSNGVRIHSPTISADPSGFQDSTQSGFISLDTESMDANMN